MEFVALGIWFIFHPGFLSYLQDFPRFWLQLDRGKLAGEEGNLVGLSGGGSGGGVGGWRKRGWWRERRQRAGVCHTQLSTAGGLERRAANEERKELERDNLR